jgi:hypothetical protein
MKFMLREILVGQDNKYAKIPNGQAPHSNSQHKSDKETTRQDQVRTSHPQNKHKPTLNNKCRDNTITGKHFGVTQHRQINTLFPASK